MRGGERYRAAVGALFVIMAVAGVSAPPVTAGTPEDQRARVQRIEDSVLAPCCYAEPVSRHQSEVAVKMRIEIAKWVAEGRTDQEILGTYVQQYGSKVLVDPRTIPGWWTPWVPWLTVIFGVVFGFWLLKRWRAKLPPEASSSPGSDDAAVLPDLEDEE
jgi:cytochrome c-type biogenesis protein CcmH